MGRISRSGPYALMSPTTPTISGKNSPLPPWAPKSSCLPMGSPSPNSSVAKRSFTTTRGVADTVSCSVSIRPRTSGTPIALKYCGLTQRFSTNEAKTSGFPRALTRVMLLPNRRTGTMFVRPTSVTCGRRDRSSRIRA